MEIKKNTETAPMATEPTDNQKRTTLFKKFCREKKLIQKDIREKTTISIGCIHNMWNDGKASPSTIKLLFLVYGETYKLTEKDIKGMITTFVD